MQGTHGFLRRGIGIPAVDLQHVDIRCIQPFERSLNLVEDGGAGQAKVVDVVFGLGNMGAEKRGAQVGCLADGKVALGHDDHLVARNVILLDGFADNDFRGAVGVGVGGIPRVEAGIVGGFEKGEGFGFGDSPGRRF